MHKLLLCIGVIALMNSVRVVSAAVGPMETISAGQTKTFDDTDFPANAVFNLRQITNTIAINGINYTYTTVEKIDSAQPLAIVTGGIKDYYHFNTFTNPASPGDTHSNPVIVGGGAISNAGKIQISSVTFVNNEAEIELIRTSGSRYGQSSGGAIHNTGEIAINSDGTKGDLIANFVGNSVYATGNNSSAYAHAYGGAIYNSGTIGNIRGIFIENYSDSSGGAVCNYSSAAKIGDIHGIFIKNYSGGSGGAVSNYSNANIDNIYGNFIGNYANTVGGAVYNYTSAKIGNIYGDFVENYSVTSSGGAIYSVGTINNIYGNFIENYAGNSGGAITNNALGKINEIYGDFIGNSTFNIYSSSGGAISNEGTINNIFGNFINNHSKTSHATRLAFGGAIYSTGNLKFSSDGRHILFSGNYSEDLPHGKIYNAVYLGSATKRALTFDAKNNGIITFNDQIETSSAVASITETINYTMNHNITLTGDGTGSVEFNNSLINIDNVSVNSSTIKFGSHKYSDAPLAHGNFIDKGNGYASMSLANSTLELAYQGYNQLNLKSLSLTGANNYISFGADFSAGTSDSIDAAAISGSGLKLKKINTTGSLSAGKTVTLFNNITTPITNITGFSLVDSGNIYTFSQTNSNKNITVATAGILSTYPINISSSQTLDFNNTNVSNETGGVINNSGVLTLYDSDFTNNHKSSGNGGVINVDASSTLAEINNSNFTDNSTTGLGGAIYGGNDVTINANGEAVEFSNNQDTNGANDICMANGSKLTLGVYDNGSIDINSGINGGVPYDLDIVGISGNGVNLNALVDNVANVKVSNAQLNLADENFINGANLNLVNGGVNIANNSLSVFNIDNLTSSNGSIMLDINPSNSTADVLNISGDINGEIKLILNSLSTAAPTTDILFAEAPMDNGATLGIFKVDKVIGSAYIWDPVLQGTSWYLTTHYSAGGYKVSPEVIAFLGLPAASLEQTRSMTNSIKNKVESNKMYFKNCCVYDELYNAKPLYNAWVNPIYHNSVMKDYTHIRSEITGIEAGFDIQKDAFNKLGIFASYRQGDYELRGDSKNYYSDIASDIDINSYISGLYYRHDYQGIWVFSTLYAGIQKADINTKDGSSSGSNGTQWGLSTEIGYIYPIEKDLTLSPSMEIRHTQISWDKTDKTQTGLNAKYDTTRQTEIEAGFQLEKNFNIKAGSSMSVYIKPSLIRPITDGGTVVSGLPKEDTYKDEILSRVEVGGKISISDNASVYGFAGHTKGSSYSAATFGLGFNMSW